MGSPQQYGFDLQHATHAAEGQVTRTGRGKGPAALNDQLEQLTTDRQQEQLCKGHSRRHPAQQRAHATSITRRGERPSTPSHDLKSLEKITPKGCH